MRTILIVFISVFLIMCQSPEKDSTTVVQSDSSSSKKGSLIISGSDSMYSDKFITSLKELSATMHIELKDDTLVLDKKDTIPFPSEIRLKDYTRFVRDFENHTYVLYVMRTNCTDIDYKIEIVNHRTDTTMHNHGTAVLNAGFFLASGTIEDDRSGLSYGVNEYSNDEVTVFVGEDDDGTIFTSFHLYNGKLDVESPMMRKY